MTNLTKASFFKRLNKYSFPLRLFITFIIIGLLLRELILKPESLTRINSLIIEIQKNQYSYWGIAALVFLMILNWAIESYKWQLLACTITPITYSSAVMGTLCGLSFGAIFPNRTGEFAGRILFLPGGYRIRGAISSFVGSFAQLTTTLTIGSLALSVAFIWVIETPIKTPLALLFGLITPLFTLFFFQIKWLGRINWGSKKLKKLLYPLKILRLYEASFLAKILSLSLTRYLVFFMQFLLLLLFLSPNFELWKSMLLIPVSFFSNTLIPTITLAELGIREFINLELSKWLNLEPISVVLAGFILWLTNVILPAFIGGLFLLKAKLFPTE